MIKFKNEALEFVNLIKDNGFQAYLVGGCVRDSLLGIEPLDYDVTTSALPSQIIDIFSNCKIIPTGIKHGTVTVIYKNIPFEVTTFRTDGLYLDNRHPDSVNFTNELKDDVSRRDFTINSICFDDEVVDYYNGIEDLNNKIIKSVGDPLVRFEEDALRIIRALRFSVKLGFDIDSNTSNAIHKKKHLLNNVSIERINSEMDKMFMYNCEIIVKKYYDIFEVVFPHLRNDDKEYIINNISKYVGEPILCYSLFFKSVSEKEFNNLIKKYHYSNNNIRLIKLLNYAKIDIENDVISIKKLLKNYDSYDIILYTKYHNLFMKNYDEVVKTLKKANNECHSLDMLAVNGNDLIAIGFKPGKNIKETLNYLLDLVIEEKVENDFDSLINLIKK